MKVTRVTFTFYRMAGGLIPKWLNNTFDNISDIARIPPPPPHPPHPWACYFDLNSLIWPSLTKNHFSSKSHAWIPYLYHNYLLSIYTITIYYLSIYTITIYYLSIYTITIYYLSIYTITIYCLSIYTGLKKSKFIFLPDSKSLINKQYGSLK